MSLQLFQIIFNIHPGTRHFFAQGIFILLFVSAHVGFVSAGQWQLDKMGEQYQISVQTSRGDKLILNHENEDTRFVIHLNRRHQKPIDGRKIQIWFDNENGIFETGFTRINKNIYQINLSKVQKSRFINEMINRVNVNIRHLVDNHNYHEMTFTLLGFTAVLNDFLIAHDIGHLDPEWLNENQKDQELMCYYAANFSVLAMLHRKQGLTYSQSVRKLKSQSTKALGEIITSIASQIYKMNVKRLPRDPRGDKYGIFQRCMESYKQ